MEVDSVWKKSLSLLENKLNRPAFEIFIKRIVPLSLDEGEFHLEIPGTLSMDYMNEYKPNKRTNSPCFSTGDLQ